MAAKLQLALDDIRLGKALQVLQSVEKYIDIIEVGTPLMMEYGMEAVRQVKKFFPHKEVLCDAKIMDAGAMEAEIAFHAGADYVSVLGVTDQATIKEVVASAKSLSKKVVVDLICVKDFAHSIPLLEGLGVDILSVHTGVDQQKRGHTPLDDLRETQQIASKAEVAVAGGISIRNIREYIVYKPDIIIVGGGILHHKDPVIAVKEIRNVMRVEAL